MRAIVNVTPGQTIAITVGAGGISGPSASAGQSSSVGVGTCIMYATGGGVYLEGVGGGTISTATGGTYYNTLPGTILQSFDGEDGEAGSQKFQIMVAEGSIGFIYNIHQGNGGNAGNTIDTGGLGAIDSNNFTGKIKRAPKQPGGGAPSGDSNYVPGAPGKVVIHW